MLRANPPPPFSMLYKKEANSRDRKFNIEKGGGGSIVEIRKEICLKYSKMTKCLNTFVAHCSLCQTLDVSNSKRMHQCLRYDFAERKNINCLIKLI